MSTTTQSGTEAPHAKARLGPWTLLVAMVLLFVLAIVVVKGIADHVWALSLEPYRSLGAGELLTQYMDSHQGQWPRSWSDIETFMGSRAFMGVGTYAEFYKCIDVDFQFDPRAVDWKQEQYGQPSFDVVKLRSGRRVVDQWNANQVIQSHLIRQAKAQ